MGEQDSANGNKIAQVEQVVAAALRPLPTQTGDGSYIQAPTVTGLAKDLLHFDLKDAKTLAEVAKSAITGEAVNDRDYIMERVIQVRQRTTIDQDSLTHSTACCWFALNISERQGADQHLPEPIVGRSGTPADLVS